MKAGKLQLYLSKLGDVVLVKIINATPSVPLSDQEDTNLQFKEAIMKSLGVFNFNMSSSKFLANNSDNNGILHICRRICFKWVYLNLIG